SRETLLAVLVARPEVVAVQGVAPGQVVHDPEAGHRRRVEIVLDDKPDQRVALWSQDLVYVIGKRCLGADVRTQLEHRLVSQVSRRRLDLLDHPPIWDIDFAGLMNPGWLIRWPSSLRQIAVSITRPRWSSDAPERIRSRS